jgi:hypothetical protein
MLAVEALWVTLRVVDAGRVPELSGALFGAWYNHNCPWDSLMPNPALDLRIFFLLAPHFCQPNATAA